MNKTLEYYNKEAENFIKDTILVDMSFSRNKFLKCIKKNGTILDFGCGSGRDSKEFLDLGYNVDAIDGSPIMCEIVSEYLGLDVSCMEFKDLDAYKKYEGIWACASIVHLNQSELRDIFIKMQRAIKDNGVIYASFKYGSFEGYRNDRYFTYMTKERLEQILSNLSIIEHWITGDGRSGRSKELWFNVLLK